MYQSNVWDESVTWDGVVFPAVLKSLKPYNNKALSIKPSAVYEGRETGEIVFDIQRQALNSKKQMSDMIKQIDKIKAIDVPWKSYLFLFGLIMIAAAIGSYFAIQLLRVPVSVLVPIIIFFLLGVALALALITWEGFKEEEIRDCEIMANLHNNLKNENKRQL